MSVTATAVDTATIHATLTVGGTVTGTVTAQQTIRGLITPADIVTSQLPYYTGEYTVTPSLDAQILDTQGKAMRDDVVVLEIPYYETSNPQGGYTAIIGGN